MVVDCRVLDAQGQEGSQGGLLGFRVWAFRVWGL